MLFSSFDTYLNTPSNLLSFNGSLAHTQEIEIAVDTHLIFYWVLYSLSTNENSFTLNMATLHQKVCELVLAGYCFFLGNNRPSRLKLFHQLWKLNIIDEIGSISSRLIDLDNFFKIDFLIINFFVKVIPLIICLLNYLWVIIIPPLCMKVDSQIPCWEQLVMCLFFCLFFFLNLNFSVFYDNNV